MTFCIDNYVHVSVFTAAHISTRTTLAAVTTFLDIKCYRGIFSRRTTGVTHDHFTAGISFAETR